MSDVLHHARYTPTQQGAIGRRMRFLADLKAKEFVPPPPAKVIPIVCASKPAPVPDSNAVFGPRIPSPDEVAFGPIVRPRATEPKLPDIKSIIRIVCAFYEVGVLDVMSSRRTANVVRPRQVAMYLAKTMTLKSLPEIGRRFSGRDHTTVLHAVRKIEGLVESDGRLADEIEVLKLHVREALLNQ